MTKVRHSRILRLDCLCHYPGRETLDFAFYLPRSEDTIRRVWMSVPRSSPVVCLDDVCLEPLEVHQGETRWIDYGTAELPLGFPQLRVKGMEVEECRKSCLLITEKLDFSPAGLSLEEAEQKLWGIARRDAGFSMLRPSRLHAGSSTTFYVRYIAGGKGLPAGALIRFAVPRAFTRPQAENPSEAGFVSVAQADCVVSILRIEDSAESHEATDIICRLHSSLRPFGTVELSYRTEHTHIFTNTYFQVERTHWYSKLPPLSCAVALSEEHLFVSPEEGSGHVFSLVPGPAERLHLFLPGRRHRTEKLSLRGLFTDRYRNTQPSGPIDWNFELWLIMGRGKLRVGSAGEHLSAPHRFDVPLPQLEPGVYRAVALRDGKEIARSNPMEIIEEGERIYWGEIHAHTEMSDGTGEFDEMYRHAKEEGSLDFAGSGDHACYFSDNEWEWMQDVTNAWNQPGKFVTLIGYEWAGKQVHRNIYTSRNRLKLFRGMYPPTSNLDVVWAYFHGDEEVVGGPHAPLAHGLLWEYHDPSVERFVEIYSMWGASDFRDNPIAPLWAKENKRGMSINDILDTGAKVGVTGGGDCHEGRAGFSQEDPDRQGLIPHTFGINIRYRCGMTAAIMPELTRKALIYALRNRRTYATTGARILLDFTLSGHPMGSIVREREAVIRVTVHAVNEINAIEIIRNGDVVFRSETGRLDAELEWTDPSPPPRQNYYYIRIVQFDREMAWSSPIWFTPEAE